MYEKELQETHEIKKLMWPVIICGLIVKIVVAFLVIDNFEYGIFFVFTYLFLAIGYISSLSYLNSKETNYHINIIYNKEIASLKKSIHELEAKVSK